jgi:hypothetical protein
MEGSGILKQRSLQWEKSEKREKKKKELRGHSHDQSLGFINVI